jgi:hypothetical protein
LSNRAIHQPVVGRRELGEGGGQVSGVLEIPVEMQVPADVRFHHVDVAVRDQLLEQLERDLGVGGQVVLGGEARQVLVRIEDVGMLVRAVHAAHAQGLEHVDGLGGIERAGGEHGHLAF